MCLRSSAVCVRTLPPGQRQHADTPNAPRLAGHVQVSLLYFCLVQGKAAEMKFLVPQGTPTFGKSHRSFLKLRL